MKYSRKRPFKKKIKKKKTKKKIINQSGGFIGTMFNVAMAPFKLIGRPLMNKLGNMMESNNNSNQSNQLNQLNQLNNTLDYGTLNNVRLNNSHINTLKKIASYGHDSNTMNSYIQQLRHINI